VNKTDLINQLAERLDGDKKKAQVAVEGFIDLVQREVQKGRNVSISGFGVFEKRARAARTARNPRTGEAVKVKKTNVPAFRRGKYFKDVIAGSVKLPKPSNTPLTARAAAAAARASTTAPAARTTRARAAAKPAGTTTRARAAAKPAAAAAAATTPTTRTRAASKTTAAPRTTTRATRSTAAKAAAAPKAAATKTAAAKAPARRATTKATPASG
jgi:DNA-binding protein HU-beta